MSEEFMKDFRDRAAIEALRIVVRTMLMKDYILRQDLSLEVTDHFSKTHSVCLKEIENLRMDPMVSNNDDLPDELDFIKGMIEAEVDRVFSGLMHNGNSNIS